MVFSELLKRYDRVRFFLRNIYLYGFRRREEFDELNARTYDNERRRLECWIGDLLQCRRTPSGRIYHLTLDSRQYPINPLYRTFRTKSFTDLDLTLHFYLLALLSESGGMTVRACLDAIYDRFFSEIAAAELMNLDQSTVQRKLREYRALGLVQVRKEGNQQIFSLSPTAQDLCLDETPWQYCLQFFSEAMPLGVIGSFLLHHLNVQESLAPSLFSFRHRFYLEALDGEVTLELLRAAGDGTIVSMTVDHQELELVPMSLAFSTQTGRQYVIVYDPTLRDFVSYRLDRIVKAESTDTVLQLAPLLEQYREMHKYMWGVSLPFDRKLEHVRMEIEVAEGEEYIIHRLIREKRCGKVEQVAPHVWRYTASVWDALEMLPWIRTFIGRIVHFSSSNLLLEERLRETLVQMYRMYGLALDDQ
ncbi:MAG: WYL domain-containing protein [Clostridia bacterium]|nr:WYL domain-containing protein [Clostridia bacterium]